MAALAFSPFGVLVSGVEEDPQGVRVYVGPRYRGRYFIARGEDAARARRAWAESFRGHLVMDRREVPYLIHEYQP